VPWRFGEMHVAVSEVRTDAWSSIGGVKKRGPEIVLEGIKDIEGKLR